jgi:hypothetical protein
MLTLNRDLQDKPFSEWLAESVRPRAAIIGHWSRTSDKKGPWSMVHGLWLMVHGLVWQMCLLCVPASRGLKKH